MSGIKEAVKKGAKAVGTTLQKGKKNTPPPPPLTEEEEISGKRLRQEAFLAALPTHRYHIAKACREAGISRNTFYLWEQSDPDFVDRYRAVKEMRLDDYEECLFKNAKAGDTTATIFALKTQARRRGYDEKAPSDADAVQILSDVLAEKMTVREAAYKFAMMGLPLPEVLKIELSKQEPEPPPAPEPISPEEMDKKFAAAMAERDRQREQFLPERQAEVQQLKEDMKGQSSFDPQPDDFA